MAEIRVENAHSKAVEIRWGVQQGCVLSPILFNLYTEAIFKETFEKSLGEGIRINRVTINNIQYVDNTVILTNGQVKLQQMLEKVMEYKEAMSLFLNTKKTKCVVFSK